MLVPLQDTPSLATPNKQEQEKFPIVLVQEEYSGQIFKDRHSSISVKKIIYKLRI